METMEKDTKKILAIIDREIGQSYKVVSSEELFEMINPEVALDYDAVLSCINVLKEAGYVDVKLMTADEICLASTEKAEVYLSKKEVPETARINRFDYVSIFVVVFAAAFLACILAKFIMG